ncbi:MAG TPA: hypothetical protein VLE53_05660 [Gemmatimonadaceae bacterium]|nr:hypothetical protein [Gemmatimonadaceae bacterium]
MNSSSDDLLSRECDIFCRYLTRSAPSAYLRHAYGRGHASMAATCRADSLIDRALLGFARSGVAAVGLADAYAARFRRGSLLRCKLILMLALVEHDSARHHAFDQARSAPRMAAVAMLVLAGMAWALRLFVAIAMFGPVQLASIVTDRPAPHV